MCGIAGIFNLNGDPVEKIILDNQAKIIQHRGPDAQGQYLNQQIGLVNCRLKIIDLSSDGNQPISNEKGNIWITFNGEIYNYGLLRAELVKQGHKFKSTADTEVVIHLYEEYGVECLKKISGMFAFAIWDAKKQELFLARDRIGVKPLFYYSDSSRLVFASEIKAVLCHPSIQRNVDLSALHNYLSLNYMSAPMTMFKDIQQILPGEYLIVRNKQIIVREYWDLHFKENHYESEEYYKGKLEELIFNSVSKRLVCDVPFGAFLSGGIDSSVIVYYMSKILSQPVKTFSMGFEEEPYNELQYARQIAKQCGTEHYEAVLSVKDLPAIIRRIVWHSEEPTADSSMIPVYYLSKMAKEKVQMVLSGDGGDELFAGYETYQAFYLARIYRLIPKVIRQGIINKLVKLLPVSYSKVSMDFKLKRFVDGAELSPEEAHSFWRTIFDEDAKRKLYSADLAQTLTGESTFTSTFLRYFNKTDAKDMLNKMLYVDTRFYLPNDMLIKVDRMSMANSLEVRSPFLDYELFEFMASVPSSLKLKQFFTKKYLLKKIMSGKLPPEIIHRKKQGFNIPKSIWLKLGMKGYVTDVLSPAKIAQMGYFNRTFIDKLLNDHFNGEKDNSYQIWGLLIFFTWWEMFINNTSNQFN